MTSPELNEREQFEHDAFLYGFNLERRDPSLPTVEPWAEYRDDNTGHRWGGFLAGIESARAKLNNHAFVVSQDYRKIAAELKQANARIEELTNTNTFDATRLRALATKCGISVPESNEELLGVAGTVLGSIRRVVDGLYNDNKTTRTSDEKGGDN